MTYEKKSGGNVLIDSNAPCKTIGIGSIQIKMHDEIVRTLTNICYVLELKKNLIFVGAMDSKGFTYCIKDGVMQITGKCKSIVIQGTKQENLYIPQGSTMTDSVSTVSQARSLVSNDNSLWYMCLCHMSKKGLEILSKQGLLGNHKVKPLQFCEHSVYIK